MDKVDQKKRNIVHVNVDDDLVIHCEKGMVLLSRSRLRSYTTQVGGTPTVTLSGKALSTVKFVKKD